MEEEVGVRFAASACWVATAPKLRPAPAPATAASLATARPAAMPPAAAPPVLPLAPDDAPEALPPVELPDPGDGVLGLGALPSSTLFGDAIGRRLIGMGSGRFIADFASCSADIAWYMSNPMKLIAL